MGRTVCLMIPQSWIDFAVVLHGMVTADCLQLRTFLLNLLFPEKLLSNVSLKIVSQLNFFFFFLFGINYADCFLTFSCFD